VIWSAGSQAVAQTSDDFIQVKNPFSLRLDKVPAQRIPIGAPDDYKPNIAILPSGELLLVAFHRYTTGAVFYEEQLLFRSIDHGITWSGPQALGLLGREPYLTALSDGTLFITVHLLEGDLRNPDTYTHSYIHRSIDNGQTWTTLRIGPEGFPEKAVTHTSRQVLELPDGTLLLGVDAVGGQAYLWRSNDRGATWDRSQLVDNDGFHNTASYFGEAHLWRAKSGKLFNIVRVNSAVYPIPGRDPPEAAWDHANHLIVYESTDTGRTFRKLIDLGDYGEMYPSLLRLTRDRLLLTFTVRAEKIPLGVQAVLGSETEDGFVFDFSRDRFVLEEKTPPDQDSGGGFGPSLRAGDGKIVTAYSYRGADGLSHVEVVRWPLAEDDSDVPLPPSNLSASSEDAGHIRLHWQISPSTGITHYNIYRDTGAGTVDYSMRIASVPASVCDFSTGPFTLSESYRFAIRAAGPFGEEVNTSVAASATAQSHPSAITAAIKTPAAGKRIWGNRVTIIAEPAAGQAAKLKQILFQYRASTGSVWSHITPPDSTYPNPRMTAPYITQWDVTSLSTGNYELRALASSFDGETDEAPATVTIAVDSLDFDINERLIAGGPLVKEQKINNFISNTVQAASAGSPLFSQVDIPPGALDGSTVTITITNTPATVPATPRGTESIGAFAEVALSNAQSNLSMGKTAVVSLGFPDDNGDGIVDGTMVRTDRLAMFSAPTAAGPWQRDVATTIDTANKMARGVTSHFSFFGLFATASTSLDSVRVYPVPFVPNNSLSDDGVPYSAGNVNSGIVFDNLTDSAIIEIYTVTGQLVARLNSSHTNGRLQWDIKNDRETDVASGGYIALISNGGDPPIARKLLIIK